MAGFQFTDVVFCLATVQRDIESPKFIAQGSLVRAEESLDQLPFTANCQTWETFKPLGVGNFGFVFKPFEKLFELIGRYLAIPHPIHEMPIKRTRNILTPNFRHFPDHRKSRVLTRA